MTTTIKREINTYPKVVPRMKFINIVMVLGTQNQLGINLKND